MCSINSRHLSLILRNKKLILELPYRPVQPEDTPGYVTNFVERGAHGRILVITEYISLVI